MTSAKAIEYRITRGMLERHSAPIRDDRQPLARHLICATALAGGMLLFGSLVPELLWALLGAGALVALGGRSQ